ncbi:MAG TPA: DUF4097 family beta strand repeat-containing protein [Blastocatellia bacterium]|jgi:DUF4097 and DUF4098 domain-containing protein YvlB|nr:DUF4097 family beta strand repeat-containing protein [Blastocatellia bacterium]
MAYEIWRAPGGVLNRNAIRRLFAFFALFALLGSSSPSFKGVAAQSAEQSRELHETYDLAPGGVVSVSNTSGYIRVTSWSEDRVKVDAVKRGRRDEDAGQIEIQVTPRPGRIDIRTIYPRNEDSRISVDYDLKVPRGVVLNALTTTSGEIAVYDQVARVTANSTNGSITVREVAGDAVISSTNGQITTGRIGGSLVVTATSGNLVIGEVARALNARCNNCNISARGLHNDATVRTVNGSIELDRIGGRANAETTNGRIRINDVGGDVIAKSYSNSITVTNARGFVVANALNGNVVVRGAGEGAHAISVSGSVEISDSKGRIEADATDGSILLNNIDGKDVSAKSANGGVLFTGGFYESGRYLFFSANGNVVLTLPPESNFNLTIKSDNGSINTEFPLKLEPGAQLGGRGPIIGVVGKGGAEVSAISANGAVQIKKAPR